MKRLFLSAVCALAACFCINAQSLQLPHFFSDGMVLQQNSDAAIWGTAAPGSEVTATCSWDTQAVRCKAGEDGSWKLCVKTPSASYTSYSIRVTGTSGKGSQRKEENIVLTDVLVGEVWLASGQSNMEMKMYGFCNCPVNDVQDYIAAPSLGDKIRMFSVPKVQKYDVQTDVNSYWAKAEGGEIGKMSATAFFFAHKLNQVLDVPVGILLSAYGGSKVEGWMPEEMLRDFKDIDLSHEAIDKQNDMGRPFMMYNAMLAPLRGYTIKGFIWYQGCSNVGTYSTYAERLTSMVQRWRSDWACDTLPFYEVEIAPCTCYKDEGDYSPAALLRQAQHDAVKTIGHSGIAVNCDLIQPYEDWNIHPAEKKPVGDRLAFLALHNDYGFTTLECNSPEVQSIKRLDDTGRLAVYISNVLNIGFDHCHGIEGLEVRGDDGVWHPVQNAFYHWDTHMLVIHEKGIVTHPVEVRYAWGAYRPGNLHNAVGLPLAPFCMKVED